MVAIVSDPIASRIRKLVEIAQELREGKRRFEITRLTRLKALCEDSQETAQFAIYIARLTWSQKNGLSIRSLHQKPYLIWKAIWNHRILISSQDYETIDEAMKALEKALADWMKQYK